MTVQNIGAAAAPTSTNVLDTALAAVAESDPALAAVLRREIESLRDGRRFGLVFNRHLPESVRLPNHPVRRGVKVALRNPQAAAKTEKDATWRVTRVTAADTGQRVAWLHGVDTPRLVDDLVVIRDFGEPVYPGLKSVERIERGGDAPFHTVINGENLHALQALRMTHRGAVDLIYIDPPYNTGNQGWIYNDKYVDVTKGDASSKWLSFMERRLVIARELLKDTGVIIVAIGDDEHHRLRMLMDQVFGPQNFIGNVTWQGGGSALARHHAGGADYMLMYGKNASQVPTLLDPKPYAPQMVAVVAETLSQGGGTEQAQEALRGFIRSTGSAMSSGLRGFNRVDAEGRIFDTADLKNQLYRPNLRYPVTNPATGATYDPPENGWTVSEAVMLELIEKDLLWFEGSAPRKKKFLTDYMSEMPLPTFNKVRSGGSKHLVKILGDKRFPFPKDHEVLMRWFRMAAPKDAVILDFFGGSGTTAEAVMRLNAEDGGTRQAILVTNNELGVKDAKALANDGYAPGDPEWEVRGVFEYVTRPRISTVVTGVRPDGSTYSDGLAANAEFFEMTYLDESRVSRAREYEAIAPLLWMATGANGERIATEPDTGWALTDHYGVLFTEDATKPFLKAVAEQALAAEVAPTHVFVVTDSDSHYTDVAGRLPSVTKAVRLYEAYLKNFEINVEVGW